MIATTLEQSEELVRLGLDPATSDMWWIDDQLVAKSDKFDVPSNDEETTVHCAWSLSALLEVMPRPDLYRETADLWVCVTFFKEGSIRGFGETNIEATCDVITKMFGKGYLKMKGGEQ